MRKGELSINMIVMAVIAIVILVLIIFLIIRSGGDTSSATACPSKGGVCTTEYCSGNMVYDKNGQPIDCPNIGEYCCKIGTIN